MLTSPAYPLTGLGPLGVRLAAILTTTSDLLSSSCETVSGNCWHAVLASCETRSVATGPGHVSLSAARCRRNRRPAALWHGWIWTRPFDTRLPTKIPLEASIGVYTYSAARDLHRCLYQASRSRSVMRPSESVRCRTSGRLTGRGFVNSKSHGFSRCFPICPPI